jgi:hypothetical protein
VVPPPQRRSEDAGRSPGTCYTAPRFTGPQRIRLEIRYAGYKRFAAESTVTFEKK